METFWNHPRKRNIPHLVIKMSFICSVNFLAKCNETSDASKKDLSFTSLPITIYFSQKSNICFCYLECYMKSCIKSKYKLQLTQHSNCYAKQFRSPIVSPQLNFPHLYRTRELFCIFILLFFFCSPGA